MISTYRMIRSSSTLLLAVGIAACGDDTGTGNGNGNGNGNGTVASVVVMPASPTLTAIDETVQLTATALDASSNTITGKTFTWASDDTDIATVNSSSGLVTAVANGSVIVRATTDGITGQAVITVDDTPVTSVTVGDFFYNPSSASVSIGTTVTWNWSGVAPHTVTFNDGIGSSGTQTSGIHTRQFTQAGTFGYFCTVHGAGVMSGEVVVP